MERQCGKNVASMTRPYGFLCLLPISTVLFLNNWHRPGISINVSIAVFFLFFLAYGLGLCSSQFNCSFVWWRNGRLDRIQRDMVLREQIGCIRIEG